MENKKLVINAAVCDTRSATEEVLNSYESIEINAAAILISTKSKELLSRHHVKMNASDIRELDEDIEVNVQNGSYQISQGTIMAKPTVLIVNGSLQIDKDSEEALKTFVSILVNGSVTYPSGLSNQLPSLKVNGSTTTYPSDAICMKNKLILDKAFIYKAKKARYFVKNKVVIADETLDIKSLVNKGVSFITRTAIIAETYIEDGVHLFDDEANIIMIPAGYSYIPGGNLNDMMVNKKGDKLYIDGDLIITLDSEDALKKLVSIRVNGSIMVADTLKDRLLDLDTEYNDIKNIKGSIIADKGILNISKQTLMGFNDGVTIIDCGVVKLDTDIAPSEIEDKLQFIDCGIISCSPEQRSVIDRVSEDVGLINDSESENKAVDEEDDTHKLYANSTQVINAATYKM